MSICEGALLKILSMSCAICLAQVTFSTGSSFEHIDRKMTDVVPHENQRIASVNHNLFTSQQTFTDHSIQECPISVPVTWQATKNSCYASKHQVKTTFAWTFCSLKPLFGY